MKGLREAARWRRWKPSPSEREHGATATESLAKVALKGELIAEFLGTLVLVVFGNGPVVDERATADQEQAIAAIGTGQAGGPCRRSGR